MTAGEDRTKNTLERRALGCLKAPTAHLQHTLAWVSQEIQCLGLFSTISHIRLVACGRQLVKCWRCWSKDWSSITSSTKKQTIDLVASDNGTLVTWLLIVYPAHIDYEKVWWQQTPLSKSNTQWARLWFKSANIHTFLRRNTQT